MMFAQIIKREIGQSSLSKYKALTVNCFLAFDRNKSVQLPDNAQILKPVKTSSASAVLRIKSINKAMKAYLERATSYEDMLKVKNDEYEIGRQHLANIMGLEAGSLTQEDIDRAIEYLLPSGLYDKKARPMMKPPIVIHPREKAAQFDNSGRPFNPFFYTKIFNYHSELHTLVSKFSELDDFEDKMIMKGILEPPQESRLALPPGEWLNLDELQKKFLEKLSVSDYNFFISTLNRLVDHPYSFRCKDLLMKFRKEFENFTGQEEVKELMYDENGRPYMEAMGYRKHCSAKVIVRGNGTGKVEINGVDIFHFPRLEDREQIMFPLEFTNMLGLVDIEADVQGVGTTAQSASVRLGLSLCLRSFVPPNMVEKMRLAGLLTRDLRRKGRKKPGQKGNRAKFTWKKR